MAAFIQVVGGNTVFALWALVADSLTVKNCLGLAAGCLGRARSPVGEGLAIA
tara:strand:- start:1048 stop:1203 length:156 start_codon:yes stop_codon:yes gene_type:complete